MATYYRTRQAVPTKYIVHPYYADENEAAIDHQVRKKSIKFSVEKKNVCDFIV